VAELPRGSSSQDCPRCDGLGYVSPSRHKSAALFGAHLITVSLAAPDAVAKHADLAVAQGRVLPCELCRGSAVWVEFDTLIDAIEAIATNAEWVKEQGLCRSLPDLAAVKRNLHDLIDLAPPVLLRTEEVKQLHNAYLAVLFDAERRLAASGGPVEEADDV
jgi:hypothetical protein